MARHPLMANRVPDTVNPLDMTRTSRANTSPVQDTGNLPRTEATHLIPHSNTREAARALHTMAERRHSISRAPLVPQDKREIGVLDQRCSVVPLAASWVTR